MGQKYLICNDYELQLTQEKTSMTIDDILEKTETAVVTKGNSARWSCVKENKKLKTFEIPVAKSEPGK